MSIVKQILGNFLAEMDHFLSKLGNILPEKAPSTGFEKGLTFFVKSQATKIDSQS